MPTTVLTSRRDVIGANADEPLRGGTDAGNPPGLPTCGPVSENPLASRARAAVLVLCVVLAGIGVTARVVADPVDTDLLDLSAAPFDPSRFPDRNIADAIASATGDDAATDRLLQRLTPFAATGIDRSAFEDVRADVGDVELRVDGVLAREPDALAVAVSGDGTAYSVVVIAPTGSPELIEGLLINPLAPLDDGPLSDVEMVLLLAAIAALAGLGVIGRSGGRYIATGAIAGVALLELTGVEWAQDLAILAVPAAVVAAILALADGRAAPVAVGAGVVAAAASILPAMSIDPGGDASFGHLVTVESLVGHTVTLQRLSAGAAVAAAVVVAWHLARWARRDRRRSERTRLAGGGLGCAAVLIAGVSGVVDPGPVDLTATGWATAALLAVAAGRAAQLAVRHADLVAISSTVADLGTGRSGDLASVIGRALDDPTVAVLHADGERFVDRDGRQVTLPDDPACTTLLVVDDETVGAIVHGREAHDDPERLRAACDAVKLSLANERLTARIRAQLDEVRASRQRLVHAEERARARIERDLHDGAQQRLTAAMLGLRMVQAQAADRDAPLAAQLEPIGDEISRAIDEIRELARGVRPAALDGGLTAAVDDLAERAPLPVSVQSSLDARLPVDVETTAYFVISEAITNAARHADAHHVEIALDITVDAGGDRLAVSVTDDGRGTRLEALPGRRPVALSGSDGSGLIGLFDRVDAHGGTLAVRNTGRGTAVEVSLPCGP